MTTAQVVIPQKQDDTNSLIQLGGLAAGAFFPGALGASTALGGAVAGAGAANLGTSLFNPQKAGPQPLQAQTASNNPVTDSNAIRRRLDNMQADPVNQLSAAKSALAYQPPDVQKQYMDTVNQALILAQRDQRRGQA